MTAGHLQNVALFRRYNAWRRERLRQQLAPPRRKAFDLVPLLLHEGSLAFHPSAGAPAGLSCFSPAPAHRALWAEYFPESPFQMGARPSLPLLFLSVMGSAGTLGFSGGSDIDFWVGIDARRHSPEALEHLQKKFRAIEAWARTTAELDIHLFITDVEDLREERYGEAGTEGCGTALGKLLKDEFYRTAIFLEGRLPFYWAFPAATRDAEYRATVSRLKADPRFPAADFLDLGNMGEIRASEFFGAALWQILKGLHSPFKSALKIGLLEKYALEGQGTRPLCDEFKRALFSGRTREMPDPYLWMVEAVRAFYLSSDKPAAARLMEECFLIKGLRAPGPLAPALPAAAGRWGWAPGEWEKLSEFQEWDFGAKDAFRKKILGFFLGTYKEIRGKTGASGVHISDRDLTVVGRKLVSFFDRKPGKIPFHFHLLQPGDLLGLELDHLRGGAGAQAWELKARFRGSRASSLETLKTFEDPLAALGFAVVNGLFHPGLPLSTKGHAKFTATEALHLLEGLNRFFPEREVSAIPADELLETSRVKDWYAVPNWNQPQWHYGLISVVLFYRTTGGEFFLEERHGEETAKWLLSEFIPGRVGPEHWGRMRWAVHSPPEKSSGLRAISEGLRRQVEDFLKGAR